MCTAFFSIQFNAYAYAFGYFLLSCDGFKINFNKENKIRLNAFIMLFYIRHFYLSIFFNFIETKLELNAILIQKICIKYALSINFLFLLTKNEFLMQF